MPKKSQNHLNQPQKALSEEKCCLKSKWSHPVRWSSQERSKKQLGTRKTPWELPVQCMHFSVTKPFNNRSVWIHLQQEFPFEESFDKFDAGRVLIRSSRNTIWNVYCCTVHCLLVGAENKRTKELNQSDGFGASVSVLCINLFLDPLGRSITQNTETYESH